MLLRFDDAIEYYNKSLGIDPGNFGALVNKGLCLSNPTTNKHDEALACFEQALMLSPDDPGALSLRGYSLDSIGRYREAIECFDKILETQPKEVNILINKGLALSHLGKYDEAIAYFDTSWQCYLESHKTWLNSKKIRTCVLNKKDAQTIVKKIRAISLYVRFIGVIDSKGKIMAYERRPGHEPLLNIKNTSDQFAHLAVKTRMSSQFNRQLGDVQFMWEEREKVQTISFAVGKILSGHQLIKKS